MEEFKKTELLNIQPNVLKMLPKEFIILNKVLPISYDNENFIVGMVNPNDQKVLNEIIFFTGIKPQIFPITEEELIMCIKNLFPSKK